jgi:hypothetical protein
VSPAVAALRADPRMGEPAAARAGQAIGLAPAAGGPGVLLAASRRRGRVVRSWPLLVLALLAAVAVWSGWVGIGELTGFGVVRPLPGIWDSLRLNTAVTLPVGVEAYAAYALRAWLSASVVVSARTRRFARWSAAGSLALGMAGQVAFHLLAQAGVTRAPWGVTTAVSCLPVLVLGMGAALAHLLRADAHAASQPAPAGPGRAPGGAGRGGGCGGQGAGVRPERLEEGRALAVRLAAAGQRVSRRSLRRAGLRGSNAELGAVAVMVMSQGSPAGRVRPSGAGRAGPGVHRRAVPG